MTDGWNSPLDLALGRAIGGYFLDQSEDGERRTRATFLTEFLENSQCSTATTAPSKREITRLDRALSAGVNRSDKKPSSWKLSPEKEARVPLEETLLPIEKAHLSAKPH